MSSAHSRRKARRSRCCGRIRKRSCIASRVRRECGSSEARDTPGVRFEYSDDGYVVLADAYYPGWSVTVDGSAAPLLRANFSSRAVAIRAGRHQVRMQYEPPGFATGWRVSVMALGVLLAWLVVAAIRARRSPTPAVIAAAA